MVDRIKQGETSVGLLTTYFEIETSEGLLSTGGSDPDYEGPAISGATVLYNHNRDGWAASAGTFTPGGGGGTASYAFDAAAEAPSSKAKGSLGVRVQLLRNDGMSIPGFRTMTKRVIFGDGPQPGDTDPDTGTVYFQVYDQYGYTVSSWLDARTRDDHYESDPANVAILLAGAVVEYRNNAGSWDAATGTFAHYDGDEFYYVFSTAEKSASRGKGDIQVRVTCTGFRTAIAILDFGIRSGASGQMISIAGTQDRWTPVIAHLTSSDALLIAYRGVVNRFQVYDASDDDPFSGFFGDQSSVVAQPDGSLIATLLPNGGWWEKNFTLRFFGGVEIILPV